MPREDARVHATRQWLAKAVEDLQLAEFLVGNSRFPGATVYHCQQASEKVLKAFLVWQNQPFRKTHDLVELGGQCVEFDPSLETALRPAAPLTDYAWKFRYPASGESEPSPDGAEEALRIARQVYEQILSRLPSEVH